MRGTTGFPFPFDIERIPLFQWDHGDPVFFFFFVVENNWEIKFYTKE